MAVGESAPLQVKAVGVGFGGAAGFTVGLLTPLAAVETASITLMSISATAGCGVGDAVGWKIGTYFSS